MSRVVDERVVSMQFDNKQFESNVATSMGTLEKLKQSLNLSSASKGLENVNAAARKCNLSPLSNAAETVGLKFNAMYTIADQSLRNIVNSAMNAGKKITSALTIDPIKTGFQEYETQINAVQTILANTQSKGTTLDDVNSALDELNKYADMTIYNFTEMTRNIGTFTAAGVDLDKSVTSIKGIANLAAVSGSTSQQASTAMYQLSQALASGTVKLQDWNSVVNAGMGGQLFQDALKRTATQMGYNVDAMIKKYGSFRESLTQGEWVTAEVLTETLTQLSGAYTEADLIAQGYSQSQAAEITKLADTAVQAATKVKTFTQLIDTLKEAAQSGWTQSWELIIGDFEEAKFLWSGVSDTLGDIINNMSNNRNDVLSGALTSNWDNFIAKINEAGISTTDFEANLRDVLKKHCYDVDTMIEKYGSFGNAVKQGAFPVTMLKEAVADLSTAVVDLTGVEAGLKKGSRGDQVKKVQEALKGLGHDLGKWGVDGIIGAQTEAAIKEFQELSGLKVTGIIDDDTLAALEKASAATGDLKKELFGLIDSVDELGGRDLLIQSFKNLWEALVRPIEAVGKAWNAVFGMSTEEKSAKLFGLIEGFESFTEKLIISGDSAEKITKIFSGLFSAIKIGAGFVGGGFKMAFSALSSVLENFDMNILDVLAAIGDYITMAYKWIDENNIIGESISFVIGMIMLGVDKIREWYNAFLALPGVQERITAIREAFTGLAEYLGGGVKKIQEFWDALKGPNWKLFFDDGELGKAFRTALVDNFKNNVLGYFSNIGEKISEFVSRIITPLSNLKDAAGEYLTGTGEKFIAFKNKISEFFKGIKEWVGDNKGALAGLGSLLTLVFMLAKIKKGISTISGAFDAFSNIGKSVNKFVKSFTAINKAKAQAIKMDAISDLIKSLAILAGAVALLAIIPEEDLKRAGKAMVQLGACVLGMVLAVELMNLIPGKSETDIVQFGNLMAKLGLALLLMTASIKILGGMNSTELTQGMWAVTAFMGMVMIMMASTKLIDSKDMTEFGTMMRKLATSLLLMSVAVLILGKMDLDTLKQGGIAVGIFMAGMLVMMKSTSAIGKDADKFGKMIRSISVALILLSVAVLILGKMDRDTLIQGGIAVAAFLGIMLGAMELTKPMSKNISRFGLTMLGLSAALIAMALSVKILGSMDTKTLVRGGVVVMGFVAIVAILAKATDLLGKYSFNAGKMGVMLLGFGAAILMITGSILLLSLIDGGKLDSAMKAAAGIGVMLAGLLIATKFAKNIKLGTLLGVSIAIGIMAASVAALAFLDTNDLKNATVALGALMGMCALLAKSMDGVNFKSMISLAGMVVLIGGIAAVIVMLSKHVKDSDGALKVAIAMATIITALSASVLLLSKVGKLNKGAIATIGILTLILGAVAGIAIWQLPNIAKQLSAFATELDPFITTMSKLKFNKSGMDALKSLGEAMWSFTKAGAVYTVFNKLGMTDAFTAFGQFIRDVVPIVKDLAMDVSGEGVEINTDNLNAVLGAVNSLAEASNKASSINIVAGGGGGKGFGGGFLAIGIPQMKAFTEWIREVIPSMKDLALAMSDSSIDINEKALTSVCEGVATLAEAASNAPSISGMVGGGGGKGFAGGFLAISIPQLTQFANWLSSVTDVMSTFAGNIVESKITAEDTDALISICEGVKVLGEAANEAPGIDAGLGLAKFAGGFGLFAGASIPMLGKFTEWIEDVIPVMTRSIKKISASDVQVQDIDALVAICEGVKNLGTAAGDAPGYDVVVGLAKFAGGGGIFLGTTVPALDKFSQWIDDVIPVMTRSIKKISASDVKVHDIDAMNAICEGVKLLGEAVANAPGVTVGLGFAKFALGMGAGLYVKVDQLEQFKTWIEDIAPVMTNFASNVSKSEFTADDASKITGICEAVKLLGEAVKIGGAGDEWMAGVAAIGPAVGAFVKVTTTDLEGFKNWIEQVDDAIMGFAGLVVEAELTSDQLASITRICEAVKILAQAASYAPKKEEYSGVFKDWVESAELDKFTTWLVEVVEELQGLGEKLSESEVNIDTDKLLGIAKSAKAIGEAVYYFGANSSMFDAATYAEFAGFVADAVVKFNDKIKGINTADTESAATTVKNITKVLTELSNFNYDTVDMSGFDTKIEEIVGSIKTLETKLTDVPVSEISAKATGIKGVVESFTTVSTKGLEDFAKAITNLSGGDFSGLSKLGDSLGTVGKDAVDKFVGAFEGASTRALTAGTNMVLQLVSGIAAGASKVVSASQALVDSAALALNGKYSSFYNAGAYVAQGFANGISGNTYQAVAKAKAMASQAYEAAKQALDINSPSKLFRSLGYSVPEGFAVGIDRMGGLVKKSSEAMADTAFEGTKGVIARLADSISADIDTQPTIRPVLDLSDVQSGASRIGGMLGMRPSVGVLSSVGTINSMMNARLQNGSNDDVISAINELGNKIGNSTGDTYTIQGITYDDGSNVVDAVKSLVRAAKVERRI